MPTERKLLTIKQAADLIGVTALTLRNWDKAGKLKAFRHPINNYRVYKREDVDKLVEAISSNTVARDTKRKHGPKKLEVRHEE